MGGRGSGGPESGIEDDQALAMFKTKIFKDLIYLFEKERAQAGRAAGRGRGRSRLPAEQSAQWETQSQDPGDVGFDPKTPGS